PPLSPLLPSTTLFRSHGRITCHTHAVDMVRIKPAGSAHLLNHRIDGLFDYRILKLFTSSRFHRLNDTVNHICAITDLSIMAQMRSEEHTSELQSRFDL